MQKNYFFKVMAIAMIFIFSGGWVIGQTTIANWTFETSIPTAAGPHNAEIGVGSALGFHAGTTTYSNPTGNGSAESFSSNGWAIGDYYQFQVSTIGYQNINLTFDQTGSNTGPRDFKVQYSTDGATFSDLPSGSYILASTPAWSSSSSTTAHNKSFNFSALTFLNNISSIYLRLINSSTVSISGATVASAGTGRVDNVIVSGTAISSGPLLSINDVTVTEGNAGTTNAIFTVTLSETLATDVTFNYTTTDITTNSTDYTPSSGSITISANSNTAEISVLVNGDTQFEVNETFNVTLSNPIGASISDAIGLGTINNDDVAPITLAINDVSQTEGNSGTTNYTFTVSLSALAPTGGITFDIATADGSATLAGGDYTANSLTSQTIPAGSNTYSFTVAVNGDATTETNETFFVNLTNVIGANVSDAQGLGTITNDDVSVTNIHDIQGSGASSPVVGSSITTTGIVTGVKSNGFFIQNAEAQYDADPMTSEGVLVFTSTAPPSAVVVGNMVQVAGTVVEFIPSQDPLSPPVTEITAPTVVQLSSGNPLPAAISLSATFPDPAGSHDQLERIEGMLASVASLTVVHPTSGSVNESNATSTSNGVLYGVVTGVARPFREAGIQAPDPAPSGSVPPIPMFDSNPERIRVDTDGLVGQTAIDVSADGVLTNVVGPVDYSFRTYSILPTTTPTVTDGILAAVPAANTGNEEFRVASYNVERFFDSVDDAGTGDAILTPSALLGRLNKASLSVRNVLKTPDIVAVIEVENLSVLQTMANTINSDAITAGQSDPGYQAFLVEGNDQGGIDVGYLVKSNVTVNSVTQLFNNSTFIDPTDMSVDILNDRPPLQLKATVNHSSGKTKNITVIVNHLRSLNGVAGNDATGQRVREKRKKQAEELANYVQSLQVANANEHIMLVGDFNAFEFNDGLVDVLNTIKGTPSPDIETAVPGDGADLVTPDLIRPSTGVGSHSYVFDGNAQFLDHALFTANTAPFINKVEYVRLNADFHGSLRNDFNRPERLSDHDPMLATLNYCGLPSAFMATASNISSNTVCEGGSITLTATCPVGYTAQWYAEDNGGTAFNTGSSISEMPTVNTSYYVSCKDMLCESARILVGEVTIVANSENSTTIAACDNYTWTVTGETYNTSGTYTKITGCHTEILNLTISEPISFSGITFLGFECPPINNDNIKGNFKITGLIPNTNFKIYADFNSQNTPFLFGQVNSDSNGEVIISSGFVINTIPLNYTLSIVNIIKTSDNCEKLITTNNSTSFILNPLPEPIITDATICTGGTYTWSVNGTTYNSATSVTVVSTNCEADQILNLTIDNSSCSDAICTTLPGDYANSAFMACTPSGSPVGVGVLMNNALNSMPKVFGLTVNNRTFTLDPTDISANIYTMMAGTSNGSSKFGLGGANYSTPSTWPKVPLTSGGQIANTLFRNALALYFNLQNSTKLGDVPMTNIQHTQPLTACGALTGTGVITSYQMPTAVISYLNGANGYPATVAGLYALANDALGGKTGVPNLSTIASTMDKINKAFKSCRLISTPSSTPSTFGTGLKVTENNQAFNAPEKGGLYVTLIEGDAETGNIMGITEIGADGISGFDPILNNTYKLILGTNPEGSRIPQAPTGYKIVGEKVTYYNEDQSITNSGNTSFADGEVEIGTANANAGAKVAAGSRIEVEFLLEPSSPLPLNLISFSATKTAENENTLNWNTSNQVNFAGFEIQKSTNTKAFETIGNISATNFSKNNYRFIDNQATEPINYYRLKMNDLDGKFEYSKIVSVKNESIQSTIGDFYPNPSQSFTQIKINASKADTYTIVAHDLMGRILQTDKMDLKEGENIVKYQTNNLPKGLSFIRIEANGISVYRKLLKD